MEEREEVQRWRWRRYWMVAPALLVLAVASCERSSTSSGQGEAVQQLAAQVSTPAFRNLGKRAESTL